MLFSESAIRPWARSSIPDTLRRVWAFEDILALERRALKAWPALRTIASGGWEFRFSDGYTKRANSANALSPTSPFAEVRQAAETLYLERGLPPIFRISPLAGADTDLQLDEAGYRLIEPSLVMTAPVDGVGDCAGGELAAASPEWLDGYARASRLTADVRGKHAAILRRIAAPAAFVTLRSDGEAVGYGLAVYEQGFVGLFDIVVAPGKRGRGHGRVLTDALRSWGRRMGARTAYLQVHRANSAALSVYDSLGFKEAYGYHYRVPGKAV